MHVGAHAGLFASCPRLRASLEGVGGSRLEGVGAQLTRSAHSGLYLTLEARFCELSLVCASAEQLDSLQQSLAQVCRPWLRPPPVALSRNEAAAEALARGVELLVYPSAQELDRFSAKGASIAQVQSLQSVYAPVRQFVWFDPRKQRLLWCDPTENRKKRESRVLFLRSVLRVAAGGANFALPVAAAARAAASFRADSLSFSEREACCFSVFSDAVGKRQRRDAPHDWRRKRLDFEAPTPALASLCVRALTYLTSPSAVAADRRRRGLQGVPPGVPLAETTQMPCPFALLQELEDPVRRDKLLAASADDSLEMMEAGSLWLQFALDPDAQPSREFVWVSVRPCIDSGSSGGGWWNKDVGGAELVCLTIFFHSPTTSALVETLIRCWQTRASSWPTPSCRFLCFSPSISTLSAYAGRCSTWAASTR